MKTWHLTAGQPLAMRFAADARLDRIDYTDDQSWEIDFGSGDAPALAFQTRYGGRAGIVRIVPMFIVGGQPVYEADKLIEQPALVNFAPNFARVTMRLRPECHVISELWVMHSHVVGGRFTITNDGAMPITVRLDLIGQAMREEQSVRMNMLALEDATEALHLGQIGGVNPVLLLEGVGLYRPVEEGVRPKLSSSVTLASKGSATMRWVVCAEKLRQDSLMNGYQWLFQTDWESNLARIEAFNDKLPTIESGDSELDAALAWSNHIALRSFITPTKQLANPTFVTARIPSRGFSPNGTGTDHNWQWNGQSVRVGYMALPTVAYLAPDLALGAFHNWLSVQADDGWIDSKPGAAGQRTKRLCPPLLAHVAWRLYQITNDKAFLEEAYPKLRAFYERWFAVDRDVDRDGYPEWSDDSHSGYSPNPLFGRTVRWAQGADMRYAESPDLGAYLLNEGSALIEIAHAVDPQADVSAIQTRIDAVAAALDAMWSGTDNSYAYRDRDTHQTSRGSILFKGKGDEAFDSQPILDPPNRMILRVIGGTNKAPNVSITVEGTDHTGKPVNETLATADLVWLYGMGAAVTKHAYQRVRYVKFSGLSRVFTTEISTVDLSRHNLTQLLPLWAGASDQDRAEKLRQTLKDKRYWHQYGVTIAPSDDPAYTPDNENGSGGTWGYWQVIMIESLLRHGFREDAAALLHTMISTRIRALKQQHGLYEAYNADTGEGLGDPDELMGILPLDLLLTAVGVRIVDARTVAYGPDFLLKQPFTISTSGVKVTATADKVSVTFPSGHQEDLTRQSDWQTFIDPTPEPVKAVVPAEPSKVEIELPPPPVTDIGEQLKAEEAPAPTVPVIVISDPDTPPPTLPEAPPPAVIPVVSKKDETMEIAVSHTDERKDEPPPSSSDPELPSTFKIPVKGE